MSDRPLSQEMLKQIIEHTKSVVEQRKKEVPLEGVRALASMQRRPIDLCSQIQEDSKLSLIAQIQRAAPETSLRVENYDPVILAKRFENSGASALSVATNALYYQGGIADLTLVTQNTTLPVIRHDFVYDEYQIVEARAAGADAVFLVAALLESHVLRDLISITHRNRMTAVVQVQSKEEVLQAVQFEPRSIAISNRNVFTFETNLDTTLRLREYIPARMAVISMGGLQTAEAVAYVQQAGIEAVLIGQELFRLAWR